MIDRIDALLGECLAESRSLTVQLSPPVLYEAGLPAPSSGSAATCKRRAD